MAKKRKNKKAPKLNRVQNDKLLEFAKLDSKSLFNTLNSNWNGLDDKKVEEQRDKFGKNEFSFKKKDTWYKTLFESFVNPFSLILLIIAIISVVLEVVLNVDNPNWSSFIIIMVMLFLSGIIKFIQEFKTNTANEKLNDMIETTTAVERNGIKFEIPIDEIVPGDIIHLAAGDMVPADLRILAAKDLFVAQAALTGESEPVEKLTQFKDITSNSALEAQNLCFMGTTVVSGTAKAIVLSTGNNTFFGTIARLINKKRPKTNFDKGIKSISWLLVKVMVIMTVIVFVLNGALGMFISNDPINTWLSSLMLALSIAVGLTPEMLPMIVTVNLSKEAVTMAKQKTIVKNINSIQSFGAMDILCTDKTGTLTEDRIVLERHLDIKGNEDNRVLMYGYLNSYYQTGLKNLLDLAIIEKAEQKGLKDILGNYSKIDEIPFDFARRRMSIVLKDKEGETQLITKGATEEMLSISSLVEYDGQIVPLTAKIIKEIKTTVEELNANGMRVIAIARNNKDLPTDRPFSIKDESNMILMGYIALLDPAKASSKKAIKALKAKGVEVKVLTGDNDIVSKHICSIVGIPSRKIILGSQIEKLSDEQLIKVAKKVNIFAKLSPEQKARVVTALKAGGHVVGFMGDGINDAPAMRAADVAISVDTAVDIAKESADFVLLEKDLMVLEKAVVEGRKTYGNIIKYIKMTISSNFGNMLSMLIASCWLPLMAPDFLPMLPVQILTLNIIYDFSQISLPWDNVDKEFMQSPRQWNTKSLLKFMLIIGPISTIFDLTTFVVMYFGFGLNGSSPESIAMFQTGWFIESLLTQMMVIYILRTEKIPLIQSWPSSTVVLTTFFLLIVGICLPFIPTLNDYLGFITPPTLLFIAIIPIILGYSLMAQFIKQIYINKNHSWL